MKLTWSSDAWADYLYWQSVDPRMTARINDIIKDAKRDPFRGLGKPEPLKGDLSGWWSRRIDGEHRFVYRVSGRGDQQTLEISACRYHY
jgi:toxin YoeB